MLKRSETIYHYAVKLEKKKFKITGMLALILAVFVSPQICMGTDYDITKGTPFEFEPNAGETTALSKIDDIHYLCAYSSSSRDGWAVILAVDTVTDTLIKGTPHEFDTLEGKEPALCKIDDTHYLCAYSSCFGDNGMAVVLTVDMSDSTITSGTAFEFDTDNARYPALSKIDDTHYLCAYGGVWGSPPDVDGWAVVLTVNTNDWTITKETAFEFATSSGKEPSLSKIDDTHFLCSYYNVGEGIWSVVLTVDTSDWTITKGTAFQVASAGSYISPLSRLDETHFLCAYSGWSVVLTVDTSDWTISKETPFQFDTVYGYWPDLSKIDNTHYLCAHRFTGGDGKTVVLTVNISDWTITKETPFIFETGFSMEPSLSKIDDSHYLCAYEGPSSDGWAVILIVELPAVLNPPENVNVVANSDNVTITWDNEGYTYRIYSSDDPYATFPSLDWTFETTVTNEGEVTLPTPIDNKKFYIVTAEN